MFSHLFLRVRSPMTYSLRRCVRDIDLSNVEMWTACSAKHVECPLGSSVLQVPYSSFAAVAPQTILDILPKDHKILSVAFYH